VNGSTELAEVLGPTRSFGTRFVASWLETSQTQNLPMSYSTRQNLPSYRSETLPARGKNAGSDLEILIDQKKLKIFLASLVSELLCDGSNLVRKQMTAAPILNELSDRPNAPVLDTDANSESLFQRLIENHLPLVRSIVERMRRKLPNKIETDELYSIGVTGLVAAARNYRPSQESSFASYATTRIRGAILDELRRMDWMSRATRSKAKRLGSAISKLEQEQGGSISQDSLCAEMHMTEGELADLMEEVRPVKFVSLDGIDEQSEAEDQSLHEIIPDDSCIAPLDVLERKEVLSLLAQRMEQLPAVPKKVLAMYYYENMRLSEIAACFGLTESRICQIHTQTVGLLRNYLVNLLA
jgi:RNA polymerase sigma factor FliA